MMAEIFFGLALMPRSETMNSSSIPLGTRKHTSRVEFDVVRSELLESFLQGHKLVGLFGLDYDVIHVSLNGFTDEFFETLEHTPLVCSPRIF
jgi:hypothetical protein